ncbi:MAG: transposase [Clostridiales Family XIII bacterium]|nr:transposase [Clostridiales Family XIII bacterium]
MITEWFSHHQNQIQIFYLPAYCQDLNPQEYLNHYMKQEFQNGKHPPRYK